MPATFDEQVVAPSFVGPLTGAVTGAVLGNTVGVHTGAVTGNVTGDQYGGHIESDAALAGDVAITIPSTSKVYYITKGSAAALTLAAPVAGTDDGKEIEIYSETAFAHVVTCASEGFNGKGSTGTATFGAAKGNAMRVRARNGHWWSLNGLGVTYA